MVLWTMSSIGGTLQTLRPPALNGHHKKGPQYPLSNPPTLPYPIPCVYSLSRERKIISPHTIHSYWESANCEPRYRTCQCLNSWAHLESKNLLFFLRSQGLLMLSKLSKKTWCTLFGMIFCIPYSAKFSRIAVFENFVEIILRIHCPKHATPTLFMGVTCWNSISRAHSNFRLSI